MKRIVIKNIFAAVFAICLTVLYGCGGGGGSDNKEQAANPMFKGAFSANVAMTQGGNVTSKTVTMILNVGSPLSGTFIMESGIIGSVSGEVVGNTGIFTVTISGTCPGSFTGSLTLVDDNTISFNVNGSDCNGSFSMQGSLVRPGSAPLANDITPKAGCYDIAVAVLRGGLGGAFDDNDALGAIKDQAESVNTQRVIAKGIEASPVQIDLVREWLDEISHGCPKPPRIVLVGHSLGGDSVRLADLPNMCSRITIDPIDQEEIFNPPQGEQPKFNQRELPPKRIKRAGGRFLNYLASNDILMVGLPLLGYRIENANEPDPQILTNHYTIVGRVLGLRIVYKEVESCLNAIDQGGGGTPWIGKWLLVNFLSTDDNGVWDPDDLSGIGMTAEITSTTWKETDDSGCAVTFSYTVDSNLRYAKHATSKTSQCASAPLSMFDESGKLEFPTNNDMIDRFDLLPSDDLAAFKWKRQ